MPVALANEPTADCQVIVTGPAASLPSISAPSLSEICTVGIVTPLPAIVPAKRPAELLYITAAEAPAACAFWALMAKVQPPRRINTAVPLRLPAGSGEQASAAEVVVPVRDIGSEPEVGAATEPVMAE